LPYYNMASTISTSLTTESDAIVVSALTDNLTRGAASRHNITQAGTLGLHSYFRLGGKLLHFHTAEGKKLWLS